MKNQKPPLDNKHLTGQAKSVIYSYSYLCPSVFRSVLSVSSSFFNPSLSVIIAVVFAVMIMGFGESAKASCDYCSEANCSNYLLCENFDVGGIPTNWHCDSHTDFNCDSCSEQDYWHGLGILGGHTDCSIWYGKITANYGIDGTNCFESDVTSVADCQGYGGPNCTTAPACNGCHGGGFKAWVSEDPLPTELWVRWYIYIPSENYDGAGDHHCNHHVFLDNGAGAYPCIDMRSTYEIPGYSGAQQHLWIGVHHADASGEKFLSNQDWHLEEHLDEWVCLEWYLNTDTNRMRFWVNGEEHVDDSDWNSWSSNKLMNGFLIGQYNCGNNDVGTTWKMYTDNVVVSTTGYIGPAESSVIFEEDFEYGQSAADLAAMEVLPTFMSKWNGDSQEGDGNFSIASSVAHSGSYSAYIHTGTGASTHMEANHLYGSDYYIDMWIYPLSTSSISYNNKLIFAYTSDVGESLWCLKVGKDRRWTGNCTHDWVAQNEGWELRYVGPGAATRRVGLSNLRAKYLIEDRWNRFVFHVHQVSNFRTDLELWIDNGDGNGLEKTGEVTVTEDQCVAHRGDTISCGRLKFGLMSDGWLNYHFDDIKVVTSPDGINWGVNDTTPPFRSNGQPTGTLSSGTTSTNISLDTDETATCKYSITANTDYNDMSNVFAMTDSTDHSTDVTDLADGNSYIYYVRCQDESNNQNPDDFTISFSIASSTTYSISNFINLVSDWLKSESGLESDVNGDGIVNTRDLGIMMSNWQN